MLLTAEQENGYYHRKQNGNKKSSTCKINVFECSFIRSKLAHDHSHFGKVALHHRPFYTLQITGQKSRLRARSFRINVNVQEICGKTRAVNYSRSSVLCTRVVLQERLAVLTTSMLTMVLRGASGGALTQRRELRQCRDAHGESPVACDTTAGQQNAA